MAYIITGLFACLIAGWVWAEYKIKNPATRLALGGAAILMLCAALYSSEQRNFYQDAYDSAAFRLLCEALDDGDFDSARDAIHHYNAQDPRQTGHVIVSFLSDRKRTQKDSRD